ncbi:MAG: CRISPR-associated endonuclease Cas2 [Lentisphaerae bacterium]|jgi:CRISPR-associated protein Cas2|nr:CRISPR-associated endonuclease Cas2 [Lentisphaerota bacterium]MBT5608964.1 CRISPR-associated endonuclease Cas2 [Lentisphaerota bacterium]MBT7061503.1 CRISPR-associated endonuclease Cas2 [Lentisphaerota bacterium]MBT7845017.1 CRISPR-associated endonuclease Cas2 [Lentisphaerota bacterium]
MDYLAVYDIADPKRLRRVAKVMEAYGNRVQKSVFECTLSDQAFTDLQRWAKKVLEPAEDSVRIYPLYADSRLRQIILGQGEIMPAQQCLVI